MNLTIHLKMQEKELLKHISHDFYILLEESGR